MPGEANARCVEVPRKLCEATVPARDRVSWFLREVNMHLRLVYLGPLLGIHPETLRRYRENLGGSLEVVEALGRKFKVSTEWLMLGCGSGISSPLLEVVGGSASFNGVVKALETWARLPEAAQHLSRIAETLLHVHLTELPSTTNEIVSETETIPFPKIPAMKVQRNSKGPKAIPSAQEG